jgi:hypothetical protein
MRVLQRKEISDIVPWTANEPQRKINGFSTAQLCCLFQFSTREDMGFRKNDCHRKRRERPVAVGEETVSFVRKFCKDRAFQYRRLLIAQLFVNKVGTFSNQQHTSYRKEFAPPRSDIHQYLSRTLAENRENHGSGSGHPF